MEHFGSSWIIFQSKKGIWCTLTWTINPYFIVTSSTRSFRGTISEFSDNANCPTPISNRTFQPRTFLLESRNTKNVDLRFYLKLWEILVHNKTSKFEIFFKPMRQDLPIGDIKQDLPAKDILMRITKHKKCRHTLSTSSMTLSHNENLKIPNQ